MPPPTHGSRSLDLLVRHWPRALAYLWIPVLYLVTLTSPANEPWLGVEPFAFCLVCGVRGLGDFILNFALFIPFGLLAVRRLGPVRTVLLGLGISLGIELAQLTMAGRFSTLSDVIANGAGTLAGVGLYRGLSALAGGARPGPVVGLAAAGFIGAVVLVGGWLLAPSPTDAGYWGQWTPFLGSGSRYAGSVVEAHLDGQPFPSGPLRDDGDARDFLLRDWHLTGLIEAGPPPSEVSSILSIHDERQAEILYLGAYRDRLLLRERLRAADWRLDAPALIGFGMLADVQPGDTVRVGARRAGDDRCLAVEGHEVCGLAFTPGRLWSLLMQPPGPPAWWRRAGDGGLLFLLFLPLGLLGGGWRRTASNAGLAAALIAVAIATTRLAFDPFLEPLSALAGLAAGYASCVGLRRFGRRGRHTEPLAHASAVPHFPGRDPSDRYEP